MGRSYTFVTGTIKDKPETQRKYVTVAGTPDPSPRIRLPIAREGVPIPYVLGRQKIFQPNVIWYGNVRAITETIREVETTSETIREPVPGIGAGYKDVEVITETVTETVNVIGYKVTMVVGVCLGPNAVLKSISINNEVVWTGTAGPSRQIINVGSSFIKGRVIFNGGSFTQGVDPVLAPLVTKPTSYPGVAYLIFEDVDATSGMGQISFEVERFPNPLGLPAATNRIGDDLNVASAIADVMTNPWGGGGIDLSEIDAAGTFTTVANLLKTENNACSIIVQQESPIPQILTILQDQADVLIYYDPNTDKIKLNAFRNQVTGKVWPLNEYNLIDIQNFRKTSWSDTVDKLHGTYTSRANDYNANEPIYMQNPANLSGSARAPRVGTIAYPAVMVKDLALKLASRDLARFTQPRFFGSSVGDKTLEGALPGDIAFVSWDNYNLISVPALITRVRYTNIKQNTIVFDFEQLKTADPDLIFAPPDDSFFVPVDGNPHAPVGVKFITAPFWIAKKAGTGVNAPYNNPFVFPLILPQPVNSIQTSFSAYIANVPNAGGIVEVIPSTKQDFIGGGGLVSGAWVNTKTFGIYPTLGALNTAIDRYDNFENGIIPSIDIKGVIHNEHLENIGLSGVQNGKLFMFINDEILSFESITQTGPDTYTLNNVHRGLLDTVAGTHAVDDPVYIIPNTYSNVTKNYFNYPPSYTPQWRLTSNVPNKAGDPETDYLLSSAWVPTWNRTNAPLRPHDTDIDGVRSSSPVDFYSGSEYTINWKTRSRYATTVKTQNSAADPGEIAGDGTYQTHTVFLVDSAFTTHNLGTTPNDGNYNSLTVTAPPGAAIGPGSLYVRATNEWGNSHFRDTLPVNVLPGGVFITQDDASYFVSEDDTNIFIQE